MRFPALKKQIKKVRRRVIALAADMEAQTAASLAAGAFHLLAIDAMGRAVLSWGSNTYV